MRGNSPRGKVETWGAGSRSRGQARAERAAKRSQKRAAAREARRFEERA